MKIISKIKKSFLILGILFAMLIIGTVYAATSYRVNSGTQSTINEQSVCKKVTNNNAQDIFVPTNTAAEWTAFRTNATGVTYAECCSNTGLACSSDAGCCTGICGTDNDGDGYFSSAAGHTGTCQTSSKPYTDCNDSCATCYPGSTSYTTASDGLDQNCNGVIDDITTVPGQDTSRLLYLCDTAASCTQSCDGYSGSYSFYYCTTSAGCTPYTTEVVCAFTTVINHYH